MSELVASELVLVTVPREEHRESFVEIYAEDEQGHRLVAIEVLSPTNKTAGARAAPSTSASRRNLLMAA